MRYLFVLLLFYVAYSSSGQLAHPQVGVALSVAIPINEFAEADQGSDAYFGLGATFTAPVFKNSPLRLGFGFQHFWLGLRSRSVEITDSFGTFDVDTRVLGSMVPLHATATFDLANIYDYPVLPYASGFLGARVFNVSNKTEIDYRDGSEPVIENDRFWTTTISYGFQVGVHVRINQYIFIDARWERAFGGKARYLDMSSVEIDSEGYSYFETKETRTDMDVFSIGIVFNITPELAQSLD